MVLEILYSFAILGSITLVLIYSSVFQKISAGFTSEKKKVISSRSMPKIKPPKVNNHKIEAVCCPDGGSLEEAQKRMQNFKGEFLVHYLSLCENVENRYGLKKYEKLLEESQYYRHYHSSYYIN